MLQKLYETVRQIREALEIDEMSVAQRKAIPDEDFVFPDRRAWPIHDVKHALIAISFMQQGRGKKADYPTIKAAIKDKYGSNDEVMAALKELG
jgi:hypothetical protein